MTGPAPRRLVAVRDGPDGPGGAVEIVEHQDGTHAATVTIEDPCRMLDAGLDLIAAGRARQRSAGAAARLATLERPVSDGCTFVKNIMPKTAAKVRACCVIHDRFYGLGGPPQARADADEELRQCMLNKGVSRPMARLWWLGVRIGGHPRWPWGPHWTAPKTLEKRWKDK